jgi:hypothetical protein
VAKSTANSTSDDWFNGYATQPSDSFDGDWSITNIE